MARHPDLDDAQDNAVNTGLAAWVAVLKGLEVSVGAAESTLQDPLGHLSAGPGSAGVKTWLPPILTTPFPPELSARANALAEKQESVTRRLEEARLDAARQLQAVSSVPGIGEPAAAVYLDVKS
ncbi:hypothetical protein [Pseudarthrobacter sp. NBSH8]|uniref:hypothetical protein n=1 Tax=Pseudarthrobacter sp. NBSH8 TaxID=2596911 RepID=UPI001627609B|nr:hypothetical protein [Pseudarthrobacter sp. NBSH8]QNE15633.1 hypothetical protein FYJ92_15265 [Pseudarthrobacter sp. NBSH8]